MKDLSLTQNALAQNANRLTISERIHRRILWSVLIAEIAFLGLGAAQFWSTFPQSFSKINTNGDNFTVAIANLPVLFPALCILWLAVVLLLIFPGWLACLFLQERPSLVGSVMFGFTIFGGLVLLSQFLHIRSIWIALVVHVSWQIILLAWVVHKHVPTFKRPSNPSIAVVILSMFLINAFVLYLNPVIRLDTVDSWNYMLGVHRLVGGIGTGIGSARNDWNAWIGLNAWITNLTGIAPIGLFHQLWPVILLPILVVVAFSTVRQMTDNGQLATSTAWLTMLAFVTSVGFGALYSGQETLAYTLIRAETVSSDKWVALVLLVPAALVMLVDQLNRPLTWRTPVVLFAALGVGTIYHPQALTVTSWIGLIYLSTQLVTQENPYRKTHLVGWIGLVIILFGFIPHIFPLAYSLTSELNGTTKTLSIHSGWYRAISPNLFIPNPAYLVAPLLIGPLLLTLLRGLKPLRLADPLRQLLASWAWAVFILYIPPFATILEPVWFPSWLDRFAWSLPFGILVAVVLWDMIKRKGQYTAVIILLTVVLLPLSRLTPDTADWRRNQQPVVDQDTLDLVEYFDQEQLTGKLLTPLPGPQTIIYYELYFKNPPPSIMLPGYGYPDVRKLYAMPWWGAKTLQTYIVNQVNWLVVERDSVVLPQIALQPERYVLKRENATYRVYQVAANFSVTPIDRLVDQLADPQTIDVQHLPPLIGQDPYSQTIVGLAYQAIKRCDQALPLLEQALSNSFARGPYLTALASCDQKDQVRTLASRWHDDPFLASTLLTESVIGYIDQSTMETAVLQWLARPNIQRDERVSARQVAKALATRGGRPDLAIKALQRLPDALLEMQDWLALGDWAILTGHPDATLYQRAGREDLALLSKGHQMTNPTQARDLYQQAAQQSQQPLANLFWGQACEAVHDYTCAKAAYQMVMQTPGDPMALYGAGAMVRLQNALGENTQPMINTIKAIASGFGLSTFDNLPAPRIRPLLPGRTVDDIQIVAQWVQPLTEQWMAHRVLEVTLTNSLPEGKTIYSNVGAIKELASSFAVYLPPHASVTWSIPITVPARQSLETPLTPIVFSTPQTSAIIAETPSWLPPKVLIDTTRRPQAVFGEVLQLREVSVKCTTPDQRVLNLTWLPVSNIDKRYTLFIHLYDAKGQLVGQVDESPFHNTYPTDFWIVGYGVQTRSSLPTQQTPITAHIGWYWLNDGSRLSANGDQGGQGEYVTVVPACSLF